QKPNAELIRAQKTNTKHRKRVALTPIEQQLEQQMNIQQRCLAKRNCPISLLCYSHKALYFIKDFLLEANIGKIDVKYHCCDMLYFQKEWTAKD
ncbi:7116_t:CDS:1, partial [Cetraspora pellucida]